MVDFLLELVKFKGRTVNNAYAIRDYTLVVNSIVF